MRNLADAALMAQTPLPAEYWRYARVWFWLGVPAFVAIVGVVFLMVFKTSFGG
jgi:uncharacterized membrane protein